MKRSIHVLIGLALMGTVLAVPAAAGGAAATVDYYTGLETPTGPPMPEPCKVTGPGLKCFQESYWYDTTTDDRMTGFTVVQANFKAKDYTLGTGHIWGTFKTSIHEEPLNPDSDLRGTWEGTWTGKLIEGMPYFKAVGHGTGEFEGLKMMAEFSPSELGIAITGRILDPNSN